MGVRQAPRFSLGAEPGPSARLGHYTRPIWSPMSRCRRGGWQHTALGPAECPGLRKAHVFLHLLHPEWCRGRMGRWRVETPNPESPRTVATGVELQLQALSAAYTCASRKLSGGGKNMLKWSQAGPVCSCVCEGESFGSHAGRCLSSGDTWDLVVSEWVPLCSSS